MKKIAALMLLPALMLASCQVRGAQVAQSPLLRFFEQRSGLIAYVARDGNVDVIDQKGGNQRALTRDAVMDSDTSIVYLSPTWSPDGRLVAFARFTVDSSNTVIEASLYTAGRNGKGTARLLTGNHLQPFYLYWAPDSRRLSMLSEVVGDSTMELGIATAGTEGDYRALDRGSPFYWGWRNDSRSIVIHTNMGQAGEATERLTLMDPGQAASRSDVKVDTGIFQSPSFSPDGRSFVYASSSDSKFTLHMRSVDGSGDRTLANDDGGAFFSFSPDGKRVAYLATLSYQPLPQGTLTVVDVAGRARPRTVQEEPVLAFFWAPNSRTLAFLMPETEGEIDSMFARSSSALYLRLMGFDPATGRSWVIARFPPSRGMISVIPYFDQYHRSATIWSPDSSFVTFTALTADGTPGLYVARADGNIKPRFLTTGDYAFWSWK